MIVWITLSLLGVVLTLAAQPFWLALICAMVTAAVIVKAVSEVTLA